MEPNYIKSEIPKVSVIIPVKNSQRSIEACLCSVREQSYPNIELIVVDNGSLDDTVQIAKSYSDEVLHAPGLRTTARNMGAKHATGSLILNIDSDMILPPNIVNECLTEITRGNDGIVLPEINLVTGFWMAASSFMKNIDKSPIEGVRMITREAFETLGGYNELLEAGEDFDLHYRFVDAGFKTGRVKSIVLHDIQHLRITDLLAKNRSYAKSLRRFLELHEHNIQRQESSVFLQIVKCGEKIAEKPHLFLGWFVILCIMKLQIEFALHILPILKRLSNWTASARCRRGRDNS